LSAMRTARRVRSAERGRAQELAPSTPQRRRAKPAIRSGPPEIKLPPVKVVILFLASSYV